MSSPTLNRPATPACLVRLAAPAVLALLAACSSGPPARKEVPPAPPPAANAAATPAAAGAGVAVPATARPEVPIAAHADFTRAVNLMRAGNTVGAEQAFKQIALQYPQFAAPLVNVGLIQRKQGQLDKAEISMKSAVASESSSAVAWTELGVTQRMRGEFQDAAASYQKAIDADPLYAPAWRNLGVLQDLYLGDAAHALASFEEYKKLTGEEKPVNGWIADLRQRLGMPPVKKPEAPAAAPEAPAAAPANGAPAPQAAPPTPAPQPDQAAAPKAGA